MIKVIFYDLGDIFFDSHKWRLNVYRDLKANKYFEGSFRDFYHYYETFLDDVYTGKKSYKDGFKDFLIQIKVKDVNALCNKHLGGPRKKERKPYPGVKTTLKRLQDLGVRNVVISDASSTKIQLVENILEPMGIDIFVHNIYTSNEVGYKKPDPKIFEYCLKKENVTKKEVLFVAHDKDELEGAKKIGIETVEYNNYLKEEIRSDHKIERFTQLFEIVKDKNGIQQ